MCNEHAQVMAARYFFSQFCSEFTADVLEEFLVEDMLYIQNRMVEEEDLLNETMNADDSML